jgi:molybdate transport system substrate-binding protein
MMRRRRIATIAGVACAVTALAVPLATATGAASKRPPVARHRATPKKRPAPLRPNLNLTGATIFAAASLTDVFLKMAPKETYSFAGSDQLAFQIQQGAPADVFASANTKFPDQLHAKGLVGQPIIFTYNNLVMIVPKSNPAHITSVQDLTRPGVKLVIGDATVPVGSYTRTVFSNLGLSAAYGNVVSNESDVKGVVAKVALGEADVGVCYFTDFLSVKNRVKYIPIPASAQPTVGYEIAPVDSSAHSAAAQAFIAYVLSKQGKAWLRKYGFAVT